MFFLFSFSFVLPSVLLFCQSSFLCYTACIAFTYAKTHLDRAIFENKFHTHTHSSRWLCFRMALVSRNHQTKTTRNSLSRQCKSATKYQMKIEANHIKQKCVSVYVSAPKTSMAYMKVCTLACFHTRSTSHRVLIRTF